VVGFGPTVKRAKTRADDPVPGERGGRTLIGRAVESKLVMGLGSYLPVPLQLAHSFLLKDNEKENRKDGWNRLRDARESVRYQAVRSAIERYVRDGFVLDVGCSQGILQEGLTYGRYVGIDSFAEPILRAAVKSDERTAFHRADGSSYVPDQPPDAVVFNEVLYYLPEPLVTVTRYANSLAPGGVLIVSVYSRAWAMRRLLRQISSRFPIVESSTVNSHSPLAWTVSVFRP
jgi:2-polyprenyl-3-methyl-5-hydroxy-6-metoxy-1,4-benzoquinol methylase